MEGLAQGEIEWISTDRILHKGLRFLSMHENTGAPPVPVEELVEFDCGMDIIPVPGLRDLEIESFAAYEAREIWIDQHVLEHFPNRYRFDLAHELGHVVLHEPILHRHRIRSVGAFLAFREESDPEALARLEAQANIFGGLLLVLPKYLRREFDQKLPALEVLVHRAKSHGLARWEYMRYAVTRMAEWLKPVFDVPAECLRGRIEADGLTELIQ